MEEFKSNTSNDSALGNSNNKGKNNNAKNNKQKEIPKGLIGNENAKAYGVYKKLERQTGQEGPEGLELPKIDVEIERYDYIGTSNVQHKVYSEKGSPMNEYYYANGEVVAQKMFGLKGRISPSKEETINTNGGLMYYEFDGLSSTTALRDRHGDKIEDYRYDVFGNIQTGITSPYNLRGYTGHLYDDKASLVYMNARWYNPNVGRFMTEDTYRGDISNPQSLNQYAYALNNPVNYVDPTGHLAVYTESKILAMSRSEVDSEISSMSKIWFEDYDIFKETGKHTEKQNIAHQNAELMRKLRPKTYYLADTNTKYGDWNEAIKDDNGSRIIYTYERTVTITKIYKNDYDTKEIPGTGVEKYDVTVTAAELAQGNQEAIKRSVGSIDLEWNEKIYETEPNELDFLNLDDLDNYKTRKDSGATVFEQLNPEYVTEIYVDEEIEKVSNEMDSNNWFVKIKAYGKAISIVWENRLNYATNSYLSAINPSDREVAKIALDMSLAYVGGEMLGGLIDSTRYLFKGMSKANFASAEKLASHFAKHGDEFKGIYKNADEFLEGAQDVMQNGTKVSYTYKDEIRTGYLRFMGNNSKGGAKFEFVGTNNLGEITTYHVESGKTFWKMLNGENIQVINPLD
ncbi:RHS repeat-associated core domain-containing protein [Sedimentibacter sp. zth1]|uniref:RHS repeat-associated core domain-containing protein n=1 Tax=Sedimentibacter sp. zth1 TaxID=2816908 RepID=UPI001A9291D7|nr:RHS repeat-associated core domain-containing protein [Sedimentibacter sp. zth1]QSX06711.1 RHS repeat-associated core domain-containing protein [Sedimentibacter sp. zth1]